MEVAKNQNTIVNRRVGDCKETDQINSPLNNWLEMASQLQHHTVKEIKPDVELIRQINKFFCTLAQIKELLYYFEKDPGRSIKGENGVHKNIGITRNAVYLRVQSA